MCEEVFGVEVARPHFKLWFCALTREEAFGVEMDCPPPRPPACQTMFSRQHVKRRLVWRWTAHPPPRLPALSCHLLVFFFIF